MREFLHTLIELIRITGPMNFFLFLIALVVLLYVMIGIYKKGTEEEKPSETPTTFIFEIEDHSKNE